MNSRGIGILGGTFDPVHRGHIDIALAAQRSLPLERVLLVPSRIPPHRESQPRTSTYHRFAMAAIAALPHAVLSASDMELSIPGPSYTSTTLRHLLASGVLGSQLFFVTGADAFAEIATWRDYPELLELCHFVVVSRPGFNVNRLREALPDLASRMVLLTHEPAPPASRPVRTIYLIDTATTDVSSTDIRRRVAAGEPVASLVPPEVETYIERHGLYSSTATADQLHGEN